MNRLIWMTFWLCACTNERVEIDANHTTHTDSHTHTTTGATTPVDGPELVIVVAGSLEDRAPDDGLGAQTPTPYAYGLRRLTLLRGVDDPAPEAVFDYGAGDVAVDMHAENEVARVPVADLPNDTFTHMQIALAWLTLDVDATLHDVPLLGQWDTVLSVDVALSDLPGRAQGDALIAGDAAGLPFQINQQWPVVFPDPGPFTTSESSNGETLVTFELMEPLRTSSLAGETTAVMTFFIADSFRWAEQTESGFSVDQWDVPIKSPPEWVLRVGANAIEVSVQ